MERIFQASNKLTLQNTCMSSVLISIPAIVRLLYSTGIRIGECLFLKNENLDFLHGHILLKRTKNQMERLLSICPSMLEVLAQYRDYRDRMPIKGVSAPTAPFFVSAMGNSQWGIGPYLVPENTLTM